MSDLFGVGLTHDELIEVARLVKTYSPNPDALSRKLGCWLDAPKRPPLDEEHAAWARHYAGWTLTKLLERKMALITSPHYETRTCRRGRPQLRGARPTSSTA